jgi:5'-methylthioadenosine phosphorylase
MIQRDGSSGPARSGVTPESVASRAVAVGIITGSGTHALPGFEGGESDSVRTPFGPTPVTRGTYAGVDALHISRHGAGHARLSNHVTHRANIWALKELGATAVIGCTACGAVDPNLELGSLVVFDDLYFPSNRLPDGSLCTFFTEPGDRARAHWILYGGPYSDEVRRALVLSAEAAGHEARSVGTYGHVDGPRFNTPSEIAALSAGGVVAVSQTAGPETALCGELELPYALIGFVTDYANDVKPGEPTPVEQLISLMGASTTIFADVLRGALPMLAAGGQHASGTVYRFEQA